MPTGQENPSLVQTNWAALIKKEGVMTKYPDEFNMNAADRADANTLDEEYADWCDNFVDNEGLPDETYPDDFGPHTAEQVDAIGREEEYDYDDWCDDFVNSGSI